MGTLKRNSTSINLQDIMTEGSALEITSKNLGIACVVGGKPLSFATYAGADLGFMEWGVAQHCQSFSLILIPRY